MFFIISTFSVDPETLCCFNLYEIKSPPRFVKTALIRSVSTTKVCSVFGTASASVSTNDTVAGSFVEVFVSCVEETDDAAGFTVSGEFGYKKFCKSIPPRKTREHKIIAIM